MSDLACVFLPWPAYLCNLVPVLPGNLALVFAVALERILA